MKDKKYTDKQIYICATKGQNDMLIECEFPDDAISWTDAIKSHIDFASKSGVDIGSGELDSFVY